jgi:hypothetical protein
VAAEVWSLGLPGFASAFEHAPLAGGGSSAFATASTAAMPPPIDNISKIGRMMP